MYISCTSLNNLSSIRVIIDFIFNFAVNFIFRNSCVYTSGNVDLLINYNLLIL